MGAFDDVRLPEDIESGALAGPMFQTTVVGLSGGGEQRNADWNEERLIIDVSYGIMRKRDQTDQENSFIRLLDFFRARRGRHRAFRFRDYADYQAVNESLTVLDPARTRYQLSKNYDDYRRRITRPEGETVVLYADGAIYPFGGGSGLPSWVVGVKGVIEFAASIPAGVVITADFLFDVPVRFETDVMQVMLQHEDAGSISQIKLLQIRE